MYIAGNEPFSQGSVNFTVPCRLAVERNIVINTIHCGNHKQGIHGLWQMGAKLGQGRYFAINSDQVTAGIPTPFDDELMRYGTQINQTYIYYGSAGKVRFNAQVAQDSNAKKMSSSIFAGRSSSKGSKLYRNTNWDLVDAMDGKNFSIEKLDKSTLPKELQKKTDKEIVLYVEQKKAERLKIKTKIAELSKKRSAFIQKKQAAEKGDKSLGSVIIDTLHKQAAKKGFAFSEEEMK